MVWSKQVRERTELSRMTQARMPDIQRRLSGVTPPSETGDPVVPLDISASLNMPRRESTFAIDLSGMQEGRITVGHRIFELGGADSTRGKAAAAVWEGAIFTAGRVLLNGGFAHPGGKRAAAAGGTGGGKQPPPPHKIAAIRFGVAATFLFSLPACKNPATNKEAYRLIWDSDD